MIAYLTRMLIYLAEQLAVREILERLARRIFHVPAPPPLPRIPALGRIPGVQGAFRDQCLRFFEVAFFDGVLQGFTAGIAFTLIVGVLLAFKFNLIKLGQRAIDA
jgi:hypothetical protein